MTTKTGGSHDADHVYDTKSPFLTPRVAGDAPTLDGLIRDLGDDTIETREAATRELLKHGGLSIPWLRRALSSEDAEVRSRAAAIFEEVWR
ncbi:MAG: hypothetical protein HYY16_13500 [Planctomycetes bacterium]|nr:hypothetical protein [Planctomycetota bacterium]